MRTHGNSWLNVLKRNAHMNFSSHGFICALDRWSPRNNLTRTKKSGKRGPVPYSYNKAKVILKNTTNFHPYISMYSSYIDTPNMRKMRRRRSTAAFFIFEVHL